MVPHPEEAAGGAPAAPAPAPVPPNAPGVFGFAGIGLTTLFATFGIFMKSFAFVTLTRSFFDHLKMTASKVDAKKKEDELERQLKQEELDGYDKAINEEWQKVQHAKREIVWGA